MGAGIGLAARMDSIVLLQIRFAKEPLFAHGALERLHAAAVGTQRMPAQTISGAVFINLRRERNPYLLPYHYLGVCVRIHKI